MKLTGTKATNFLNAPNHTMGGILLYGAKAMNVALKRQALISTLIGKRGREEMRLTTISGQHLSKNPAALNDALHAQSFFAGVHAVLIEDATDKQTKIITTALSNWTKGDANLVVTAQNLRTTSSLRKLFENAKNAVSIGIYDNPLTHMDINRYLKTAKIENITPEAVDALVAVSTDLDPGNIHLLIEKIALYKYDDKKTPISTEDINACLPNTTTAAIDNLICAVAEADSKNVIPFFQRLKGQGTNATTLCIAAGRHFRMLHRVAHNPKGIDAGLNALKPPVFGPLRTRLARQAKSWNVAALETAITTITTADLALRHARQNAPPMALVERAFLHVTLMSHTQ